MCLWVNGAMRGLPGGNVVQATRTSEALNAMGCTAVVSTDSEPPMRGFDILHAFNPSQAALRGAREAGMRIAVSPIYWPLDFTSGIDYPLTFRSAASRCAIGARTAFASVRGAAYHEADRLSQARREQALTFENADVLLPNSREEASRIASELRVSTPSVVVPNAADPSVFRAERKTGDTRRGVVMAGRFEPLKNQLRLIEACRWAQLRLTLVGPMHPDHPRYYQKCLEAARRLNGLVTIVDSVPQNELREIFAAHRVHALPSWFETTGLVSLEAGLAGCSVVTTTRGYSHEYFGDLADYCDPGSVTSIASALLRAVRRTDGSALAEHVTTNFTWRATATATVAAYRSVLA